MKYSVIEEIYYGNRGQNDNVNASKKYKKLNSECVKLIEDLSKTLKDGQKEKLEKIIDMQWDMEADTALTFYKEGLKIGLLLFSECLRD